MVGCGAHGRGITEQCVHDKLTRDSYGFNDNLELFLGTIDPFRPLGAS